MKNVWVRAVPWQMPALERRHHFVFDMWGMRTGSAKGTEIKAFVVVIYNLWLSRFGKNMTWQLKRNLASKRRRGGTHPSACCLRLYSKNRVVTVLQSLLVYTWVCLIHKTKQVSIFYHITLYWAHWGAGAYSSFLRVRHTSPPQKKKKQKSMSLVCGRKLECPDKNQAHTRGANTTKKPSAPPRGFRPLHHRVAAAELQKSRHKGGKKI